jgi:saccharopine dehydrogenase-like NADP-dependent oxidoreductase
MRILVLGVGRIGRIVAIDLLEKGYEVYVSDLDKVSITHLTSQYDVKMMDYGNVYREAVNRAIDLVCTAIPSTQTPMVIEKLISNGLNVVDVTGFGDIDPSKHVKMAQEKGVILSLYNGLAPGLSHILAGRLYKEIDNLESLEIYVGGLPETIDPGIIYTFNPIDYLRQYIEPARHIKNGVIITYDPLDYSGIIDIPDIGLLEYFPTNGLYSLLWNLEDVKNKSEFTLRYMGHLDIMRSLRHIGLLDTDRTVVVRGLSLTPLEILAEVTSQTSKTLRDIVILYVVGRMENKSVGYIMIDKYDMEKGISAMARTTGYMHSIIAQLYLEKYLDSSIHYPEEIGLRDNMFNIIIRELKRRGIAIEKRTDMSS